MSPEMKLDFESEWALLVPRLKSFLRRKNVPVSKQDDLIQETALRLYKMWGTVDRRRPAWALTVTIALNLLRDEYRRAPHADVVAELPDIPQNYDVERAGLARVEIGRVRQALAQMTPAHRGVLLAEVGHSDGLIDAGVEKMRRMRARRKLVEILERVSGALVLPGKRLADLAHAIVGVREGALTGVSCVLCAILGIGAAVTLPLGLERAHAGMIATKTSVEQAEIGAVRRAPVATVLRQVADVPDVRRTITGSSNRKWGVVNNAEDSPTVLGLPVPSDLPVETPEAPLLIGGPGDDVIPEGHSIPGVPVQLNPTGAAESMTGMAIHVAGVSGKP